jgi:hypothetical protein
LKLNCDELVSGFAFNFNLRRYNAGIHPRAVPHAADPQDDPDDEDEEQDNPKHGAAGPKIDFSAADAPKNLRQLAARVAQKEFIYPVESAFITSQNQAKLKPRDQIKRMRNLPVRRCRLNR